MPCRQPNTRFDRPRELSGLRFILESSRYIILATISNFFMPTTADSHSSLSSSAPPTSKSSSSSSYFVYPVAYAVSGLLRRLSADPEPSKGSSFDSQSLSQSIDSMDGVYTPPHRHVSPFQPPPLTPLTLNGYKSSTPQSAKLLTRALAEEIRLLVPPRLQLVDEWNLTYSLEQNGVSLATLYEKCDDYRGKRGGFVLVIRDGNGGVTDS